MNKIEKRTLIQELKYKNTVILKYRIEYPEIILSDYDYGKDVFNKYNRDKAIKIERYAEGELFEDAKQVYDYNKEHGYPVMVYEIIVEYEITYNKNRIVSLYQDEYIFTGGAHGNTTRTSQNWDLETAMQIPLHHFFPNNEYYVIDILKSINKQIQEQIKSGEKQYFDNYCELVLENFKLENYYLYSEYIEVFFQQYDIAPYVAGILTFKI